MDKMDKIRLNFPIIILYSVTAILLFVIIIKVPNTRLLQQRYCDKNPNDGNRCVCEDRLVDFKCEGKKYLNFEYVLHSDRPDGSRSIAVYTKLCKYLNGNVSIRHLTCAKARPKLFCSDHELLADLFENNMSFKKCEGIRDG